MNWRLLVAVLLLTSVVSAQAAPVVVTYPPGDDKIVVVHKGDAAPFTGQLYDDQTALRWAIWLQQYKGRYALDLKAEQDTCAVEQEHSAQVSKIDSDRDAAVNADLTKRLQASEAASAKLQDSLNHPSFFKDPNFWFGVGVITSLVTVLVTAAAIHKTQQ